MTAPATNRRASTKLTPIPVSAADSAVASVNSHYDSLLEAEHGDGAKRSTIRIRST